MKKQKHLNVIYDPLSAAFELLVVAGSTVQNHNANTDEFSPDRSITPLTLSPSLFIADPSGMTAGGDKTNELHEVRYYKNAETAANLIVSGQDDFVINAATSSLTVMKNVPYLAPVTIICTAAFYDGRSGQVYRFSASVVLSSTSAIDNPVTLELDKPGGWTFDPLTDSGLKTITAHLRLAGAEVTDDERRRFWWYVVTGTGVERLVDPEDDLFYEDGQNTAALTIDPRYVNGELWLRCRAEYVAPGEDAPDSPTTSSSFADSTVARRYSKYDLDFVVHGSDQVAGAVDEIRAEGWAKKWNNLIAGFEKLFYCVWSIKRKAWGTEWRTLGYGKEVTVSKSDYENGADLEFELQEHESLKAASSGDTAYVINNAIVTL